MLEIEIENFKRKSRFKSQSSEYNAPFKLQPNHKMINVMKMYRWNELSPILCDKFGHYEALNWRNIKGNMNWLQEWEKVKKQQSGWLCSPPLILPLEYGECVIVLLIGWENNQLEIQGMIPSDVDKYMLCPDSIVVETQISVSINKQFFKNEKKPFQFIKSNWPTRLLVVSKTVSTTWDLPTVQVQVFPSNTSTLKEFFLRVIPKG